MAGNNTQRAPSQNRGGSVSRAVFRQQVPLGSVQAQKAFNRNFGVVARELFFVGVILRIIGDDKKSKEADELIDRLFTDVEQELTDEAARLDHLLEENGIAALPEYTEVEIVEAEISSPEASRYLKIIKMLDECMHKMDALWLSGVLNNHQKVQGSYLWQRRVIKTGNRIRDLGNRFRNLAKESGINDDEAAIARRAAEEELKKLEDEMKVEQDAPAPKKKTTAKKKAAKKSDAAA